MTTKDTILAVATLVESQPEAFDYVRRLELERALFAVTKDFALAEFGIVLSGFSDNAIEELKARASDRPCKMRIVDLVIRVLQKIQLISSGDPYITLEGEEIILEGRREVVVSLAVDLLTLQKEFD